MKSKLLLRNVGDIWDKSGNKRVTGKRDQDIINMASCRGLSVAKNGTRVIFPQQEGIESYIEHVADFLMPGKEKKEQMAYMNSVLIPAKLLVGDATSEDYLESPSLADKEVQLSLKNCELEPYVDGERVEQFAKVFVELQISEFDNVRFLLLISYYQQNCAIWL